MKIDIRDDLVQELRRAMKQRDNALGAMAIVKADERLGAASDALIQEMMSAVQKIAAHIKDPS